MAGYRLASWGGALSGSASPASLLMNGNKTVTATFELIPATQYLLTVTAGAGGSITSCNPASGGSYAQGTQVSVTATPSTGCTTNWSSNWMSGPSGATGNTASFSMPGQAATLTANFTCNTPGGPGTGTETNPLPLTNPLPSIYGYGYDRHYTPGDYLIPRGKTLWFVVDPKSIAGYVTAPPTSIKINVINYDSYQTNVSADIYVVNRNTPTTKTYLYTLTGQATYPIFSYDANNYYLVAMKENGTRDQMMTLYWRPAPYR
jgi:hypothetical protein